MNAIERKFNDNTTSSIDEIATNLPAANKFSIMSYNVNSFSCPNSQKNKDKNGDDIFGLFFILSPDVAIIHESPINAEMARKVLSKYNSVCGVQNGGLRGTGRLHTIVATKKSNTVFSTIDTADGQHSLLKNLPKCVDTYQFNTAREAIYFDLPNGQGVACAVNLEIGAPVPLLWGGCSQEDIELIEVIKKVNISVRIHQMTKIVDTAHPYLIAGTFNFIDDDSSPEHVWLRERGYSTIKHSETFGRFRDLHGSTFKGKFDNIYVKQDGQKLAENSQFLLPINYSTHLPIVQYLT